MTSEEVIARLGELRARAGDDESAHGLEDALRHDVLKAIASGEQTYEECCELARLALSTTEIEFERWCA